jgi:hypothetical protein
MVNRKAIAHWQVREANGYAYGSYANATPESVGLARTRGANRIRALVSSAPQTAITRRVRYANGFRRSQAGS